MQSSYTAIIFDLYGVLIANSWQDFKKLHFTVDSEARRQMIALGRQVDAGKVDYADFVQFIAAHTGESPAVVKAHLEHNVPNTVLLDYIATVLKPTYKIGVLSNASTSRSADIFTASHAGLLDAMILSRDVGYTKPQPEMYQLIAAKLGVQPEECVYIDDQPEFVAGAEAVGMRGLVYSDDVTLRAQLEEISV